MLRDFTPVPTLAVSDLAAASAFYESLGFSPGETSYEGTFFSSGSGSFFIYTSDFAGTNKATAMSFMVPGASFDQEVEKLRSAGVTFETFDAPGITWDNGVATMDGGGKGVWFKDPDGNFISLDQAPSS